MPRPPTDSLLITNPARIRVVVTVGETASGELHPGETGVLRRVRAGTYAVRTETPDGSVRAFEVRSTPAR